LAISESKLFLTDVLDNVFASIAGDLGPRSGMTTVTCNQQCYSFKSPVGAELMVLLAAEVRLISAGSDVPLAP
jgi:hypothetical protein